MVSETNGQDNIRAAVELAEILGWHVLPVWWIDEDGACACGDPNCSNPGKHPLAKLVPRGLKDATSDCDQIRAWWTEYPRANVAVRTGPESGLWVPDLDGPTGIQQFQQLTTQYADLPETPTVATGGNGRHLYFAWPRDHEIRNKTKIDGLSIDIRGSNGYVLVPPSNHVSGQAYRWELEPTKYGIAEAPDWLLNLANGSTKSNAAASKGALVFTSEHDLQSHAGATEGLRNDSLCRLVGKYLAENGIANELLPLAIEWGRKCQPPLDEQQVVRTVQSLIVKHTEKMATQAQLLSHMSLSSQPPWPDPMDEAAYHGLAGEIVRTIEPHSETDPVAILLQVLTAFGNAIGRSAYFAVESDRHYLKLFLVLVGPTSKGRKGTSWGHVCRLFSVADEGWARDHISHGLSSGEGLIWAVRDEIRKREPVKEKGRVVDYREFISDEGVLDKRLLVVEAEFASTLRVLGRDGNTLSPILRSAWDVGNLQTLTKNNPARATGSHVSVIGHITTEELRRYLTSTEACNGFGNRFLWACVKRSKCLPEGGNLAEAQLHDLAIRLREALEYAIAIADMTRDETTRKLWHAVYPELSNGAPGLFGALTSRAEAQTMRLACLYALLDMSVVVRRPHLEAALAVWSYVEDSVRHVFGDALGHSPADEILQALRLKSPDGLSRTEIRDLFRRHLKKEEITSALSILTSHGLAHTKTKTTSGRSAQVWFYGPDAAAT